VAVMAMSICTVRGVNYSYDVPNLSQKWNNLLVKYRLHHQPQPERARSQTRLHPDGSGAATMSGTEPQYSFGRGWVRRSAAIHEEAV
jgi:hypothetical protein